MGVQGEFFEKHPPAFDVSDGDAAPVSGGMSSGVPVAAGPIEANSEAHTSEPHANARRMMKDLSIPKLYYSISEVSRLTGLEAYVLRYWESEFEELRPQKNRAGNRVYSNRDIKFILRIKELLREQRYTIEGAKHILRGERVTSDAKVEAIPEEQPHDPAQLPLPADAPKIPSTPLTLDEIREMKHALEALRRQF